MIKHRVRSGLARWMNSRPAGDFHVQTRISGLRVELHAVHVPSGHQFITDASDFETAAGELTKLVEKTFASSQN